MKKLFYVVFLLAGISLASLNTSNAQDNKAKAACCNKEKVGATAMKSGDCPMKATAVASTTTKADCPKNCPMAANKDCPMAGTKDCPKSNCPMKAGTTAGKETSKAKTGTVAEAKTK
jgi:hypothetical protein